MLFEENRSSEFLNDWILANRLPHFVRITNSNLHLLLATERLLAIGIVEETRSIKKLTSEKHTRLRDLVRRLSKTYERANNFVFSWTSYSEIIDSIAIKKIQPLPSFIVINSTNLQYYQVDGEPTAQSIINLLNDLSSENNTLKVNFRFFMAFWIHIFTFFCSFLYLIATRWKWLPSSSHAQDI